MLFCTVLFTLVAIGHAMHGNPAAIAIQNKDAEHSLQAARHNLDAVAAVRPPSGPNGSVLEHALTLSRAGRDEAIARKNFHRDYVGKHAIDAIAAPSILSASYLSTVPNLPFRVAKELYFGSVRAASEEILDQCLRLLLIAPLSAGIIGRHSYESVRQACQCWTQNSRAKTLTKECKLLEEALEKARNGNMKLIEAFSDDVAGSLREVERFRMEKPASVQEDGDASNRRPRTDSPGGSRKPYLTVATVLYPPPPHTGQSGRPSLSRPTTSEDGQTESNALPSDGAALSEGEAKDTEINEVYRPHVVTVGHNFHERNGRRIIDTIRSPEKSHQAAEQERNARKRWDNLHKGTKIAATVVRGHALSQINVHTDLDADPVVKGLTEAPHLVAGKLTKLMRSHGKMSSSEVADKPHKE